MFCARVTPALRTCYKVRVDIFRRRPSNSDPQRRQLLDLLRNARRAGLPHVPAPLRGEFERKVMPDAMLEGATHFLLRGHEAVPEWKDLPPDPWRANRYVEGFLHGLLRLHEFDAKVRAHNGDPALIAERMAQEVQVVAFWMPRQN